MLYNRNDSQAQPSRTARRLRHLFSLGLCLLAASAALRTSVAAAALRLDTSELVACADSAGRCGDLERPLDPSGAVPGSLQVHFEFYPHTAAGVSQGTLVAAEGGPGYPATLSRDAYLALFKPLRRHRDVLLMDNRGTGRSGAIDCHSLQAAEVTTTTLIGACGRQLDKRAALYSTALAADDLAAILQALGIEHIDLYGDSYGTYFAQIFVRRHPMMLDSVVLDGAYPLDGPDYPWYPTDAPAVRNKFNVTCARFAPCAALHNESLTRIGALLESLRQDSPAVRAVAGNPHTHPFSVDPQHLAMVMFGSAPAYASLRDLDAAARAYAVGDRLPLLRLMNESIEGVDSRSLDHDPAQWSAGLAVAVMCQDPAQIINMQHEPDARALELDQILAARQRAHPNTYAPFTIEEFRRMPLDYSFITQCVAWPAHPSPQLVPPHASDPAVPVLVLSGELDNMTTVADGRAVAAAFPHARQIVVANSFHVNALPHARSGCGMQLVRQFLKRRKLPDTSAKTGCAARVPALRLTSIFARQASALEPLRALPNNRASLTELRLAAAAVATLGDVLAHARGDAVEIGVGLRGGIYRQKSSVAALQLQLHEVRFTEDVSVSGHVIRKHATDVGNTTRLRDGNVTANVTLATRGGSGALRIHWSESDSHIASVSGTINGHVLLAQTTAP